MSGIQRKGRFEPDKVGLMLSSIFLDQLDTHRDLEHLKPWFKTMSTGNRTRCVYKALESSLCHKQKRSTKKIFWNLKRLWKVLHTLRDHHTNVVHSGPLVCYSTLLEETSFFTSIFISPDSACPRKVCKEHFRTRNIFWTESNQVDFIRQQKG